MSINQLSTEDLVAEICVECGVVFDPGQNRFDKRQLELLYLYIVQLKKANKKLHKALNYES